MLKKIAVTLLTLTVAASISNPAFARRSSSGHSSSGHHSSSHRSSGHAKKVKYEPYKSPQRYKVRHCKKAGCYKKHPEGSYLVYPK
ncbi:MAG TPA: hypothetical protein VFT64_02890 [Rickettsiales bacterium]|nr:hypothetical protein [Rickettsiales bacterium]